MCIRCRGANAPEPLGYCAPCAMHARIELTTGFRRLEDYLAGWAAWREWLQERGLDQLA